jgi:hypothetical protein
MRNGFKIKQQRWVEKCWKGSKFVRNCTPDQMAKIYPVVNREPNMDNTNRPLSMVPIRKDIECTSQNVCLVQDARGQFRQTPTRSNTSQHNAVILCWNHFLVLLDYSDHLLDNVENICVAKGYYLIRDAIFDTFVIDHTNWILEVTVLDSSVSYHIYLLRYDRLFHLQSRSFPYMNIRELEYLPGTISRIMMFKGSSMSGAQQDTIISSVYRLVMN